MRFLVDAQLPPRLARWLADRGHVAEHVADIGLIAASDDAIVEATIQREAALVSKDEDFVYLRMPDRFAFVWLRVGNATNRSLEAWMERRWPALEGMLRAGERFIEVR